MDMKRNHRILVFVSRNISEDKHENIISNIYARQKEWYQKLMLWWWRQQQSGFSWESLTYVAWLNAVQTKQFVLCYLCFCKLFKNLSKLNHHLLNFVRIIMYLKKYSWFSLLLFDIWKLNLFHSNKFVAKCQQHARFKMYFFFVDFAHHQEVHLI